MQRAGRPGWAVIGALEMQSSSSNSEKGKREMCVGIVSGTSCLETSLGIHLEEGVGMKGEDVEQSPFK